MAPRSLTINAGTSTVTFGAAVGSVFGLASLAVTAATTNLYNSVTTADVVGNDINITGAVTLANPVATTLTLNADQATYDGTITITGTTTGTARNLALFGGAISTAAITTTGGADQDGGTVTITGSGPVSVTGTVTTSGRRLRGRQSGP